MEKKEMTSVEDYVDDLMQRAGFDKLPEEFHADYREKLAIEVQRRIGILSMQHLSKKDLTAFSKMLEEHPQTPPEKVTEFFNEHIEDFPGKIAEGLGTFAEEYLTSVAQQKQQRPPTGGK